MPGTGKTTIEHELQKLGYDVINTDEEWGYYGNIETEAPVEHPVKPTAEWYKPNGYIWNSKTVRPLLSNHGDKPLFICGGSRNEAKFYDLFTKIFVLHISNELMRERLLARNDPNSSSELFMSRMVEYNKKTYEHARNIGGTIIETAQPLELSMQKILSAINDTK